VPARKPCASLEFKTVGWLAGRPARPNKGAHQNGPAQAQSSANLCFHWRRAEERRASSSAGGKLEPEAADRREESPRGPLAPRGRPVLRLGGGGIFNACELGAWIMAIWWIHVACERTQIVGRRSFVCNLYFRLPSLLPPPPPPLLDGTEISTSVAACWRPKRSQCLSYVSAFHYAHSIWCLHLRAPQTPCRMTRPRQLNARERINIQRAFGRRVKQKPPKQISSPNKGNRIAALEYLPSANCDSRPPLALDLNWSLERATMPMHTLALAAPSSSTTTCAQQMACWRAKHADWRHPSPGATRPSCLRPSAATWRGRRGILAASPSSHWVSSLGSKLRPTRSPARCGRKQAVERASEQAGRVRSARWTSWPGWLPNSAIN